MKTKLFSAIAALLFSTTTVWSQYHWPVTPLHQSQLITGTFCEYRDTSTNGHFHNGVDIPKPDGSPVYAVQDARVTSLSSVGSNAFVRTDRLAYVHIRPSPSLSIGDSVFASTTVLGTILPGLGHVHLIDGFFNSERNALRANGGLVPYDDPWAPQVSNVRFYQAETRLPLQSNILTGRVEITALVRERNGPPGSSSSVTNNGAYTVGYQVLSSDRSTVVFSPTADGVQFRFDNKPNNSLVGNVFDKSVATLSRHVYRLTNRVTSINYLNTADLPEGEYTVMIFAGDTRSNVDTLYVEVSISHHDVIPPAQPDLIAVLQGEDQNQILFSGQDDFDLEGFRLFAAPDFTSWSLLAGEDELDRSATNFQFTGGNAATEFFHLTAVDTVTPPNASVQSDVYGLAASQNQARILIVDGFDRTESSGSWQQPWHEFAALCGQAIAASGFGFSTCANEALFSGAVDLLDYDAVFWLLGDESTADQTFNRIERQAARRYLDNGGQLFVTGSEIAWDMEGSGNASSQDTDFLHDYLKVEYAGDDAGSLQARGESGSVFASLATFNFGVQPYEEDFPDYFEPVNGGQAALRYGNGRVAGVQYAGAFGNENSPGKMVIIGFPFETIAAPEVQEQLIAEVLAFFFPTQTAVAGDEAPAAIPRAFALAAPFPNPFQPAASELSFAFALPQAAEVTLAVYDLLGRKVQQWQPRPFTPGRHRLSWDGRDRHGVQVANGIYFVSMRAETAPASSSETHRFVRKIVVQQ